MKVCEVCGSIDRMVQEENELSSSKRVLHVCENCRNDRKFPSFDSEELL